MKVNYYIFWNIAVYYQQTYSLAEFLTRFKVIILSIFIYIYIYYMYKLMKKEHYINVEIVYYLIFEFKL